MLVELFRNPDLTTSALAPQFQEIPPKEKVATTDWKKWDSDLRLDALKLKVLIINFLEKLGAKKDDMLVQRIREQLTHILRSEIDFYCSRHYHCSTREGMYACSSPELDLPQIDQTLINMLYTLIQVSLPHTNKQRRRITQDGYTFYESSIGSTDYTFNVTTNRAKHTATFYKPIRFKPDAFLTLIDKKSDAMMRA